MVLCDSFFTNNYKLNGFYLNDNIVYNTNSDKKYDENFFVKGHILNLFPRIYSIFLTVISIKAINRYIN
jgi:hypothetical protein